MSMPDDAIKPEEFGRGDFTAKKPAKRKSTAIAEGEPPAGSFDGPSDEGATLRLMRTTWGGMLVAFTVELDGFYVGELAYGAMLEMDLSAGVHVLVVSGGGAFFSATERFFADQNEFLLYTVCYSWYGGISLSRVRN